VATGRFGHPVSSMTRLTHESRSSADLNGFRMNVLSSVAGIEFGVQRLFELSGPETIGARMMQRKPTWQVEVSIGSGNRAAGR